MCERSCVKRVMCEKREVVSGRSELSCEMGK